jgi:hypothetical protein
MGKVIFGLSVSLDGFIAGKNDDVSQVFSSTWNTLARLSLQEQAISRSAW